MRASLFSAALAGTLWLGSGCKENPENSAPSELAASPRSDRAGGQKPSLGSSARACVYFKELRKFLPSAPPGYKTLKDEGSTGKYGDVAVSEAERVFGADEGREVSIRIVDTSASVRVGEAIKAALAQPHDSTVLAPLLLPGAKGYVRYSESDARAEANLYVGERFLVALTTRGIDGTDELRKIAEDLNLAGLSKLH